MENLIYGQEDATPLEVRRAAELARIHDEIMAMPAAYESRVAERGQNLSGGQRQRIALARVFLKNPPILLLDEATAALDNINEKAVREALAATRADRTTILVAHRLTTLNDADEILVFDKGRIVERGAFKELEQAGGLFARLVRSSRARPRGRRLKPDAIPAVSQSGSRPPASSLAPFQQSTGRSFDAEGKPRRPWPCQCGSRSELHRCRCLESPGPARRLHAGATDRPAEGPAPRPRAGQSPPVDCANPNQTKHAWTYW